MQSRQSLRRASIVAAIMTLCAFISGYASLGCSSEPESAPEPEPNITAPQPQFPQPPDPPQPPEGIEAQPNMPSEPIAPRPAQPALPARPAITNQLVEIPDLIEYISLDEMHYCTDAAEIVGMDYSLSSEMLRQIHRVEHFTDDERIKWQ